MKPYELRAHARAMLPVAADVWTRYRDLREVESCAVAPDGCPPSVIAQGLNDAGLVSPPFDVAGLKAADEFEARRRDISIVIPSKNTRELLETCITAVMLHAAYPTEVIVVDGGSTDGTLDMLAGHAEDWPRLIVVKLPGSRSFAESCNAGAREASGRVIVFLNSDAIVCAKWDAELMSALKSDPLAGAAGPLSNAVKGKQKDWEARYVATAEDESPHESYAWDRYVKYMGVVTETHDLSGLCIAVPAEVWDAVGDFDERFQPGNFEDNDWCARATFQGFKLFIARGAFVHHIGGQSFVANGVNYSTAMETNRKRFADKWSAEMAVAA